MNNTPDWFGFYGKKDRESYERLLRGEARYSPDNPFKPRSEIDMGPKSTLDRLVNTVMEKIFKNYKKTEERARRYQPPGPHYSQGQVY